MNGFGVTADRDELVGWLRDRGIAGETVLAHVASVLLALAREWKSSDVVDVAMWLDGTL